MAEQLYVNVRQARPIVAYVGTGTESATAVLEVVGRTVNESATPARSHQETKILAECVGEGGAQKASEWQGQTAQWMPDPWSPSHEFALEGFHQD